MSTEPRVLWSAKGDTITCIHGHPICDIARDIYVGDGRTFDDFTNWRQPEPKDIPYAQIRCTECRGVWVRADGWTFHFADDTWR